MQNKFYISIFTLLFLSLTLVHCNKNHDYPTDNYIDLFAQALSKALVHDKDLRDFVKKESKDNVEGSLNGLLINCIRHKKIGDRRTFEQVLSQYIGQYNSEEIFDSVAFNFPSLELKIPDKFYNIDWDTSDNLKTPSVVYYNPNPVIYFNGKILDNVTISGDITIYYINLKLSESMLAVSKIDKSINNSDLFLNDILGDISDSCMVEVDEYINSIQESCKNTQIHVLVSIYDLYEIINKC